MIVVGDRQYVLLKYSSQREVWALHEMGGAQPRVGWLGCVHESIGYLTEWRHGPDEKSQWIFGYQSLQAAAEALVAERLAFGADPVGDAARRVGSRRVCDACNRSVLVVVTDVGQTVFCDDAVVSFVDLDGVQRSGNTVHKCRRR